ncbi:hypothetical protein BDQ12DRAFT_663800 [Crucibulum laeve]|uniref:Glycosyltransferase 61 catalytic domain-containing protein n=1 Tax=Crucibulum laeve TaxID=68775 RepID=A0A5C3MBF8_9AGAR|nr:hypothetical protein BDQ12DRAFT_663800 [Crucibulum laeve]
MALRTRLCLTVVLSLLLVFIVFINLDLGIRPRLENLATPYLSHVPSSLGKSTIPSGDVAIDVNDGQVGDLDKLSAETTIPGGAHVHGFTVMDKLYLRNGTFFVLTSDVMSWPPRVNLLSHPVDLGQGDKLLPTDEDLQFVHPSRAHEILGENVLRIPEFSVIVYDPPQFMNHFYHWWGEIILGAWRTYSRLSMREDGKTGVLPLPSRFILPAVDRGTWRDRAGVDGPLMRAAFPRASIEVSDYWADLRKLNTTVVFDRALIVSRDAAHKHPFGSVWFKMIAGTMNLTVPDNFWTPVQQSLVKNLIGHVPQVDDHGLVVAPPALGSSRPIVTYISRQGGGRRLLEKDHEGLVVALRQLEEEGLCDVRIAQMERLTLKEQIELVARSTIIVGVHGNGLTHQLWMPPSKLSTVIEIVYPDSYAWDYEMLARNMGHRHYEVWNDTLKTYPKGTYYKGVKISEYFHSDVIPVYGPAIAQTIRERLNE